MYEYENEIKLVIIGSGVSGLAMAKAAIEKNIPYIILERMIHMEDVGLVHFKHRLHHI